ASDVTVSSGATLGGSGSVRTITAAGTVSPGGPGTGILRGSNALFNAGSSVLVKVNGTQPGTGFDQLNVSGGVDLTAGPALTIVPGFAAVAGNTFTILTATGSIKGTFSGTPNNALLNLG